MIEMNSNLSIDQNNPKVSIIILNWNGWKDTIECLESLYQITYYNYDVILIDNGSEDESIEKIKEYCNGEALVESKFFKYEPRNKPIKIIEYKREEAEVGGKNKNENSDLPSNRKLILIKNEKNYGFAEGNNIGIKYALKALNPDYILLLNNDTVVDRNFITNIMCHIYNKKFIGISSPIIYEYYKDSKIQYGGEKINWYIGTIKKIPLSLKDQIIKSDTICGASMLIRKDVIYKIGLLPTDYFMLWEDIDYSTNAIRNGFACVYIQHSKIWHKGSVSIGKISNPFRIKYSMLNRFIFWKKYSKPYQFLCFSLSTFLFHFPIIFYLGVVSSKNKKRFCYTFFNGILKVIKFIIQDN